jgi:hypothetical protein
MLTIIVFAPELRTYAIEKNKSRDIESRPLAELCLNPGIRFALISSQGSPQPLLW